MRDITKSLTQEGSLGNKKKCSSGVCIFFCYRLWYTYYVHENFYITNIYKKIALKTNEVLVEMKKIKISKIIVFWVQIPSFYMKIQKDIELKLD